MILATTSKFKMAAIFETSHLFARRYTLVLVVATNWRVNLNKHFRLISLSNGFIFSHIFGLKLNISYKYHPQSGVLALHSTLHDAQLLIQSRFWCLWHNIPTRRIEIYAMSQMYDCFCMCFGACFTLCCVVLSGRSGGEVETGGVDSAGSLSQSLGRLSVHSISRLIQVHCWKCGKNVISILISAWKQRI